jgi:hypothetical protein
VTRPVRANSLPLEVAARNARPLSCAKSRAWARADAAARGGRSRIRGAPLVALSAGVHGDEPAGPWALLSIVRDGLLDARFNYRVWCCTNPSGYERGTRENAEGHDINRSFNAGGTTPEARAIVTSNRDRRFALGIDLARRFRSRRFLLLRAARRRRGAVRCASCVRWTTRDYPVQEWQNAINSKSTSSSSAAARPASRRRFAAPAGEGARQGRPFRHADREGRRHRRHGISGAVVDPKGLDELLPDWRDPAPLESPVTSDAMWYLTNGGKMAVPGSRCRR